MGIFYIYTLGVVVLLWIEQLTKQKFPLLTIIPLSYFIGCVVIVTELLVISTLGGTWSWPIILTCNLVISALGLWLNKYRLKELLETLKHLPKKLKIQDFVMIGLLIYIYLFYRNAQLQHDFLHSDGLTYWFMKGKLFFEDKYISHETLSNQAFVTRVFEPFAYEEFDQSSLRPTYPIFVPLLIVWQFMSKGTVDILSAKYLWFHLTLGTLVYLYWLSKQIFKQSAWGGLVGPFLFTGLPYFWFTFSVMTFGTVDPWISTFVLVAVSLLYLWIKQPEKVQYMLVSSILVGATAFVKVEGIFALSMIPIILLGDYIRGNSLKLSSWKVLCILISLLFVVVWFWHTSQLTIETTYSAAFQRNLANWPNFINNIFEVIPMMILEMSKIGSHGVYWYVWFGLVALFVYLLIKRQIFDKIILFQIVVMSWFVLMAFLFTFSPEKYENFISTAFNRYIFQVEPLLIFFIMVLADKCNELLSQPKK